jgi:predicted Zn-dependent protease
MLSVAAVLAACTVNPATGRRELALIGQGQEIAMGREADGQISESLGLVNDPALQTYVSGLGLRLASVSERPDLPWSFKVVDDPAVNAFALPGGFIYLTRGILAHFESEAELVGVLGHEIGHVTARHSVTRMSRQQVQRIGLGVGMILSEDVRKYGGLLSTGLGLINLRYSRGDETESDELGARYMTRVGYDAHALTGVFRMLAGVSGGGGRAPEWRLTHPHPENREARIRQVVEGLGSTPTVDDGRDRYLDRIHGLVFGENPREGYFRGALFLHPDLEFQLRFPEGWRTVNQRAAVAAVGPGDDALVVLEIAAGQSDAASALRAFLATDGVTGGQPTQGTSGAGLRYAAAGFTLAPGEDPQRGQATFVEHGGRIYRILGMASRGKWTDAMARTVGTALGSFAPLTDRAVLAVRPWTLQIVALPEAMTVEEFHRRYPTPIPLERTALLNRRDPRDRIPAGTRVKRVVGERWP